jgi:hypothetical protein
MKFGIIVMAALLGTSLAFGQGTEDCQKLLKIIRKEKISESWKGRSPEWVRPTLHKLVDALYSKQSAAKFKADLKPFLNKKKDPYEYKYKDTENVMHKFIEEELELQQLFDLGDYLYSALEQKAPAKAVENFVFMKGHGFKWADTFTSCQKGDPTVKWTLVKKDK